MENKIEKGLLGYSALTPKDLESGKLAILRDDNKFLKVTLIHKDISDAWNVSGDFNGNTVPDPTFYAILFYAESGIYNVNIKEWHKVIDKKLIEQKEEIECVISDYPFKEGKYSMTCSECNAGFLGSKRQPYCKECCAKNSTASLLTLKADKIKRVRLQSKEHVSKLLNDAYTYGTEGMVDDIFNEWSEKQLKRWQ
tara:strand:- start:2662 stop:3249 length:588 start_codon:yes stop_codon:yes gene_type:complete